MKRSLLLSDKLRDGGLWSATQLAQLCIDPWISTGFQTSDLSANGIQEESLYFIEDSMYGGAGQLPEDIAWARK